MWCQVSHEAACVAKYIYRLFRRKNIGGSWLMIKYKRKKQLKIKNKYVLIVLYVWSLNKNKCLAIYVMIYQMVKKWTLHAIIILWLYIFLIDLVPNNKSLNNWRVEFFWNIKYYMFVENVMHGNSIPVLDLEKKL